MNIKDIESYIVISVLTVLIAVFIYKLMSSLRNNKRLLEANNEAIATVDKSRKHFRILSRDFESFIQRNTKIEDIKRQEAEYKAIKAKLTAIRKELSQEIGNERGQTSCPCCEERLRPMKTCKNCKYPTSECICVDETEEMTPVRTQ